MFTYSFIHEHLLCDEHIRTVICILSITKDCNVQPPLESFAILHFINKPRGIFLNERARRKMGAFSLFVCFVIQVVGSYKVLYVDASSITTSSERYRSFESAGKKCFF